MPESSPPAPELAPSTGPSNSPQASAPPAVPRGRGRIRMLLAIIVVIAVVLGSLFALGVIKTSGASSSSGGTATSGPVTFDTARTLANKSANAYEGATTWQVVLAGAVLTTASLTVSAANFTKLNSTCTATEVGPGPPVTLTVPAFTGSVRSGAAPVWEVWLVDSTGDLLLVLVQDGSATAVALVTEGTCPALSAGVEFLAGIPSSAVDSSVILSNTEDAGGSAFRANHTTAFVAFSVLGGISFDGLATPPSWTVAYTTCAPIGAGTPSMGPQFSQVFSVYATNGTVYNNTGVVPLRACPVNEI